MPSLSLTPCRHCRKATRNANGYCDAHQDRVRDYAKLFDNARAGSPVRALYRTTQWQTLRRLQLRRQPLCEYCMRINRVALATVCDHIRPHRGDQEKFFDPANLQSLCKRCHDSTKQREEKARQ